MNVFTDIRGNVLDALEALVAEGALPEGLDFTNVAVEPPRDPAHGQMATNAAMVLAKPAGQKPRDIAEALAGKLREISHIERAEVAGPGFLNLDLSGSVWHALVGAVLAAPEAYGRSGLGAGQRVNVEYISANPTGPLHVGHTRGAVFGDALASLLDFAGYQVTREYYINDGGGQIDTLRPVGLSPLPGSLWRGGGFPDGTYPGDYLVPVGQALKDRFGDQYLGSNNEEWLPEFREFATEAMMDLIRADLASLGIEMDIFFSEKSLYGTGRIEAALDDLRGKGLIYEGVLEPPKGKVPEDWEPREQTLFKSTEHGDDVDRPVMKSDGAWTYFAPDIAYHFDKVERGFDQLIDVFGADHGGYVKRMKAAVSALSDGKVSFDIKLTQLVKLFKNGEPFKMSKRAGTYVTLRDVVDEVGPDVTRFHMLTRKNDATLDFDFDKVLEQSKDNPVFYVQYAHARVCSVLDKASDAGFDVSDAALAGHDLAPLKHPSEIMVTRKLGEWPRMVDAAALAHEPHRIAFYLYDLASEFHALWNKGNDLPELRFLQESDREGTNARLALIRAVSVVISSGLGILSVTPLREMR